MPKLKLPQIQPHTPLWIHHPKSLTFFTLLTLAFLLPETAYCDHSAASGEMDKMATTVVDTIFAPWVRKTALALGGGLGLFQSISGGGWKPLVGWGGLGIFINYIPKIINFLSTLGT